MFVSVELDMVVFQAITWFHIIQIAFKNLIEFEHPNTEAEHHFQLQTINDRLRGKYTQTYTHTHTPGDFLISHFYFFPFFPQQKS